MMKKKFVVSIFFAILCSCFALAQEPVLFDGSNPVVLAFQGGSGQSALPGGDAIPQAHLITPEELSKSLRSSNAKKPLLFAVGPHTLYAQAHIPGSEYIGAGSSQAGQQKLAERVKGLPHNTPIVIYCGCCPWGHCPNMHPAYQTLKSLGFTNVKALYIADNFGTDWVNKGYPVATGE
jgi:thiosulfate/3-mercaptopyruvate sulfurtransferase